MRVSNCFFVFIFYAFQNACIFEEEDIPMGNRLRCEQDGFCITNQSGKWLQGGYRKGGLEVEFDVVNVPDLVVTMNGGKPYAARLVLGLRHQFGRSVASGYPKSWDEHTHDTDYHSLHYKENLELIREMNDYLPNHTVPKGFEVHWEELLSLVKMMAEIEPHRKFSDTTERDLPEDYLEQVKHPANTIGLKDQKIGHRFDDNLSDTTSETYEHHHGNPGTINLYMGPFKKGSRDPAPSQKKEKYGYEFKQTLELWSHPIQEFLWWGKDTGKHHTSAKTYVYKRPIGSNAPWDLEDAFDSGNHGLKPRDNGMTLYAICENFPVTKNYYTAGGECDGFWGLGHVCNDDTAYQVWHAYGNWNGGSWCKDNYRLTRPGCEEPWEREFK